MTPKENFLHYLRREPYDYVPEGLSYIPVDTELDIPPVLDSMSLTACNVVQNLDAPVCERPMMGDGYDIFGVHWSATSGISHYTPNQPPIYDDIELWREQVRLPNVDRLDWDTFRREAEKIDTENKLVCMTLFCGLFERATMLTSMDECLMDVISAPDNFRDMMGAIADYKIALINKICEYIHPDIIIYHDDWGTSHSTFMSCELWRETIKPHTKRLYDAMLAQGITICQHSCGCLEPLIGDIVEMGAHMFDAQKSCNDLAAISAKYADKLLIVANDIGGTPPPPPPGAEGAADGGPPPFSALYPAYTEKPDFLYD